MRPARRLTVTIIAAIALAPSIDAGPVRRLGSEFQVNSSTLGYQRDSSVGMGSDGRRTR